MEVSFLVSLFFISASFANKIRFNDCKETYVTKNITKCYFSYNPYVEDRQNLTFYFRPDQSFESVEIYHFDNTANIVPLIKKLEKNEFPENSWNQIEIAINVKIVNDTPKEVVYYVNAEANKFNLTEPLRNDKQLLITHTGGWEGPREFALANPTLLNFETDFSGVDINGMVPVATSDESNDAASSAGNNIALFICILVFLFGVASFIFGFAYYLKALKTKRNSPRKKSTEDDVAEIPHSYYANRESPTHETEEEFVFDQAKTSKL